jgi:hypothetical protein
MDLPRTGGVNSLCSGHCISASIFYFIGASFCKQNEEIMTDGMVKSNTNAWQSALLHSILCASEHSQEPAGEYKKRY